MPLSITFADLAGAVARQRDAWAEIDEWALAEIASGRSALYAIGSGDVRSARTRAEWAALTRRDRSWCRW